MRALIFELRPGNLENDGLLPALRTHTAALQGRIGLPVVVTSELAERLPLEVEEVLYRIAQEALHNVVKHAAARGRSSWRSTGAGADVVLRIRDDGKGFDQAAVPGRPSRADRDAGPGGQDRGDVHGDVAGGGGDDGRGRRVPEAPSERRGRPCERRPARPASSSRRPLRLIRRQSVRLGLGIPGPRSHWRNDVARFGTSIPVGSRCRPADTPAMTDPAAAPAPLRVLLVDPDDRVRESLAGLLRIGAKCLVIGSAGTADGAVLLAAETAPDVVVVDPRLPGIDGARPHRQTPGGRARHPRPRPELVRDGRSDERRRRLRTQDIPAARADRRRGLHDPSDARLSR